MWQRCRQGRCRAGRRRRARLNVGFRRRHAELPFFGKRAQAAWLWPPRGPTWAADGPCRRSRGSSKGSSMKAIWIVACLAGALACGGDDAQDEQTGETCDDAPSFDEVTAFSEV